MIEAIGDVGGDRRLRHHLRPIEQKIVVVEHVLALLGLDIGGKQLPQLGFPILAPGKERAEHLVERQLRIHDTRIDREAGAFGGKARFGSGKSEIVPDEIDEIGGILAVVNGERAVEADLQGVFTQQPGPDGVEGAGPGQRPGERGGLPVRAHDACRDALDPARHLGGGAPREGEQQDAAGIDAVDDEMRDPMRQGVGLAGAGARDDQQRTSLGIDRAAVLYGAPLIGIELDEISGGHEPKRCESDVLLASTSLIPTATTMRLPHLHVG